MKDKTGFLKVTGSEFLLSNAIKGNDLLCMNVFQNALIYIECLLNEIFPSQLCIPGANVSTNTYLLGMVCEVLQYFHKNHNLNLSLNMTPSP